MRRFPLTSAVLLVTTLGLAIPAMAQTAPPTDPSGSNTTPATNPSDTTGAMDPAMTDTAPPATNPAMATGAATTPGEMSQAATDDGDDDHGKWGLAGLLGLKRRDTHYDATTNTTRRTS